MFKIFFFFFKFRFFSNYFGIEVFFIILRFRFGIFGFLFLVLLLRICLETDLFKVKLSFVIIVIFDLLSFRFFLFSGELEFFFLMFGFDKFSRR